jgi:hypothetical protein
MKTRPNVPRGAILTVLFILLMLDACIFNWIFLKQVSDCDY